MLLTEEQARTKWCPLVRNGNEPGCNRDGRNRPFGICIASECMAWRQEAPDFTEVGEPKRGFCGLAGKAEG